MSRGIADPWPAGAFVSPEAAGVARPERPSDACAAASRQESQADASGVARTGAAGCQAKTSSSGVLRRCIRRGVRHLPSVLVLAMLAGLGAYGHHSGWKLPKFWAPSVGAETPGDEWCEEHSVPEAVCVECHPALLPPEEDFGWCKAHGIPNCPLEHPRVVQLKTVPTVHEEDRQRGARALASAPRPENNPLCKNYRRRIQFASLEAMRKAGVDVAVVDRQEVIESLSVHAEVRYDQTRLASVASRLSGIVWRVEKNVGDAVQAGQLLALVDAPELGRAKAELLEALAQSQLARQALERMERLAGQGIVPGRQLQAAHSEHLQAQARLMAARQALANLGLPAPVDSLQQAGEAQRLEGLARLGLADEEWRRLGANQTPGTLLPVRAPLEGVVVARHAVAGEAVEPLRLLFQVADIRRMWLMLSVPVEDAPRLALGQRVRYRPEGSAGWVEGTLAWISTTADPQTRMVLARAELPNPDGRLRNETFGMAEIVLRDEPQAVVVPREAVQWEGCCFVVFVRDRHFFDKPEAPKVFHVRPVRLGARSGPLVEVAAGLWPGEVVAAQGSEVLRGELLKNALGEGCAEGH